MDRLFFPRVPRPGRCSHFRTSPIDGSTEVIPFMRRVLPFLLIVACFGTLFLSCYAPVLFGDRQFGYRDAAQYYYPLYQRVQEEWNAGSMAALGARGERGYAAPGKPDRGSAVSRQTHLRDHALCVGCKGLHRDPYRAGICVDARLDAVMADKLDRIDAERCSATRSARRSCSSTAT